MPARRPLECSAELAEFNHVLICAQFGGKWWCRHVRGVCTGLLMMGANLVGFILSVDDARYFTHELNQQLGGSVITF